MTSKSFIKSVRKVHVSTINTWCFTNSIAKNIQVYIYAPYFPETVGNTQKDINMKPWFLYFTMLMFASNNINYANRSQLLQILALETSQQKILTHENASVRIFAASKFSWLKFCYDEASENGDYSARNIFCTKKWEEQNITCKMYASISPSGNGKYEGFFASNLRSLWQLLEHICTSLG